jgi:hypothetical protein
MHGGRLVALGSMAELREAAALPVRIRFTVAPCSTGRILAKLEGMAEVLSRGEREIVLGCVAAAKPALFRALDETWQVVEDVAIEVPGLPALYSRLVEREEGR